MNTYYQDPYVQIIQGDCREVLAKLPAESAQCIITSPPYWGKRKYPGEQELIWGGDKDCDHQWVSKKQYHGDPVFLGKTRWQHDKGGSTAETPEIYEGEGKTSERYILQTLCVLCGAWKGAFGREPTPEMYIDHTIEILRAIRRVLRKDGVVFWNIGDTYYGSSGGEHDYREDKHLQQDIYDWKKPQSITIHPTLKPKDLCLIPFRVAIAAQEDGWWVRKDIIWNKTNPKPESVEDRPTTSHDYILMFTKSDEYYWDADAVREPATYPDRWGEHHKIYNPQEKEGLDKSYATRNIRSVWTFPTQSFSGAHFAVFPDDLPKICIKAATPEVGCCSMCGAPWDRIMTPATGGAIGKSWHDHIDDEYKGDHKTVSSKGYKPGETIGWRPTCNCNADKVPSIVVDPFAGTGTTGKVAKVLGRKAILIDTGEGYCEMAKEKIMAVALPMLFPVEETYIKAPDWF